MPRRRRLDPRTRLNLVLAAAVVLLALLAWFKPGLHGPDVAAPLVPKATDSKDIRIAPAHGSEVTLRREADGWHMTTPLAARADDAAVDGLLELLAMPADQGFPAAGDLGRYGLDNPLLRLTLGGTELELGGMQPLSQKRYVLLDGRVHLVSAVLFYRLAQGSYAWLDKRLLPAGSEIEALQLPQVTVTRDRQGHWQLAPADKRVNAGALAKLVQAWQDARADNIIALGKGAVEGEVALSLKGAIAPLRFQIYKDTDSLVLARPDLGLQYQLDPSLRATLLLEASSTPPG